MLYYKFKNYEEFKDMFGIIKHGNGVCSRKNKILLAYIRNKRLLHEAINCRTFSKANKCTDMENNKYMELLIPVHKRKILVTTL